MSYRLLKEHPNQFEMSHPDGTVFHVAKSGLNKTLFNKIRKYADGGEVTEDVEANKAVEAEEAQKELDKNYGLSPWDAQMAGVLTPENQKAIGLNYNISPEQKEALKQKTQSELVSGVVGSVSGGIRPKGKFNPKTGSIDIGAGKIGSAMGNVLGEDYGWWLQNEDHNLPYNRPFVLEDLRVDPSAQGFGVGAALIHKFEREAVKNGADAIFTNASPMGVGSLGRDPSKLNDLIRFYEKHGFKVYQKEPQNAIMIKDLRKGIQKKYKGGEIDPMNYKLLKEHPTHFEMQHPDGSSFHVAKNGLKPDMLKKIKGYADGGEVEEEPQTEPTPEVPVSQDLSNDISALNAPPAQGSAGPSPVLPAQAMESASPVAPSGSRVFGPQQTEAPSAKAETPDLAGQFAQNIAQKEKAITGAAEAQAAGGNEAANLLQAQQAQIKSLMDKHQANWDMLKAEQDQLSQDVINSKIDPNRLWHDASLPAKVAAGIGLILGGIGSGLTGQPNAALQTINNLIDRDLAAQKANLGKKESLLSMNFRKFGDLRAATQATLLQLNAATQGQLAAAAARTGSQVALQNAQGAIADLKNQAIPMQKDLASWQMLQGQAAGGNSDVVNAAKVRLLVPPHQQAEVFKDLQTAQTMVRHQANLNDAFDKAEKLDTPSNRILNPIQSKRQIDTLVEPVLEQLVRDSAGRINEKSIDMLKTLFPSPLDNEKTLGIKKQKLNEFISTKMSFPTLDAYGIKPTNLYNSSGSTAISEAPAKGE